MAWRPNDNLIEGELDNTTRGRVTGWLSLVGVSEPVTLCLTGDFHRDIRGAKIRLRNPRPVEASDQQREYMRGFATHQTGPVGDITAGLLPQDYVNYPYIEWYSEQNGRIVLEPGRGQVEVIGTPLPWENEKPISREQKAQHMERWMAELAKALWGGGSE